MKALIRKHGFTPTRPDQDEVFLESQWPHWMTAPDYGHLTDENYGYALCEDCPSETDLTVEDFTVTEHSTTSTDDFGETVIVRSWTAVYTPRGTSSPEQSEIDFLKKRLAELGGL